MTALKPGPCSPAEPRAAYLVGLSALALALDAATGETVTSFGADGRVDLRDAYGGAYSEVRPLQTANPGRIFENLVIMSLPED